MSTTLHPTDDRAVNATMTHNDVGHATGVRFFEADNPDAWIEADLDSFVFATAAR